MVKTGQAIPVFYDEVDDSAPPDKQLEGLSIPSFPALYKKIKGTMPSGQLWDAYRTLFEMNSRMLRVAALPPGAPPAAVIALRTAIERLNHDKEFAAEATKVIEFTPEYRTAPDLNEKTRAMLVTTPEMRGYINEYTRNVPKR
jgi:hypothetical protein